MEENDNFHISNHRNVKKVKAPTVKSSHEEDVISYELDIKSRKILIAALF
jgi:hypothetical protein